MGDLRVEALTDFPERFERGAGVWAQPRGDGAPLARHTVERVTRGKRHLLVKLSGVDSRAAAQALAGGYLKIGRDELRPLPEGSFYVFEIIGLDVLTGDGRALGRVSDVLKTGANDVYVVKPPHGGRDVLIPALKAVVKRVDLETRTMIVELPEGLVEAGAKQE
ncbi:MAG: 16S rRNA processing protein RimM [Firmicutes bacterium]|nr:16S rRNA processing protein RimM [Bacillota bacterium]